MTKKISPISEEDSAKSGVFLVDDHPLVREWLTNLVNGQLDLSVCGEAEDAAQALSAIGAARPLIAVVDLSLKSGSGLELVKDIKLHYPAVGVIVLSMYDESLYAERALRAGARGYVMKRETTQKILAAIRCVLAGGVYVSERFGAAIAAKLVSGALLQPGADFSPAALLSDRELEVFALLGQGRGTPQIGDLLGISPKTVQAYCARIKEKLGFGNATELLRAAFRFEESNSVG
jgi:DNA-binding NarL/FixJ family response regulator